MRQRSVRLQQVDLPQCRLVLSLLRTDGDAVWELSRPGRGDVLLHVAATGPNVLVAGFVIRRRRLDAALALGHVQYDAPPHSVRFTTARIRWREEATTAPQVIAGLWVAEATGAFDLVVVREHGEAPDHVARLRVLC